MKMFYRHLLLLLTLSTMLNLVQSCSEGCVKCEINPEGAAVCKFCDFYNSYYLNGDSCQQRLVENCLIPSVNQNEALCNQCKQGFILDNSSLKCVEVPETSKVDNCRSYSLVGNCSACFRDYYLDEGQCKSVEVVIENCHTYFSNDLCQICEKGFYFDVPTSTCVSFEEVENCRWHSRGECKKCSDGLILNKNSMFFQTFDEAFVQNIGSSFWKSSNFSNYPVSYCIDAPDSNCEEYATELSSGKAVHLCSKCKTNYFFDVSTSKCVSNPGFKIENCTSFIDFKTCSQCSDEFYLECNECKTRSSIYVGCLTKNTNMDGCAMCEETYYLDSSDVCQLRQEYPISGCTNYHYNEDLCIECSSDHILTEDQTACFTKITGCMEHKEHPYKSENNLLCNECETNYVLNDAKTQCLHQNIENCDEYEDDSILCKTCGNKYYLSTAKDACTLITIDNCEENVENEDKCEKCDQTYHLASDGINCQKLLDENCVDNSDRDKNCTQCEENYYLKENDDAEFTCVKSTKVFDVSNCDASTSDDEMKVCTDCEGALQLIDLTNYVFPLPTGCKSLNSDGNCDSCSSNHNTVYTEILANSIGSCTPVPSPTKCGQKITTPPISDDLGDNDGYCLTCNDADNVLYENNICFQKSSLLKDSCAVFGSLSDCTECKEGYIGKDNTIPTKNECAATPSGFVAISGCLAYNVLNPTECKVCSKDYRLNNEFKCVQDNQYDRYALSSQADFGDPLTYLADVVSNMNKCNKVIKNNNGSDEFCMEHKSDFGIIQYSSTSLKTFPLFSDGSGVFQDNIISTNRNLESQLVTKTDGANQVSYVQEADCAKAFTSTSGTHNSCVECKNGKNMKYVLPEVFTDVAYVGNKAGTVESCDDAANEIVLEKKYSGLTLRRTDFHADLKYLNLYVGFDSCPDSTETLVVVLNDNIQEDYFIPPGDGSVAEHRYHCQTVPAPVDNCHVYSVSKQNTANADYTSGHKCIACKPGFYPTSIAADFYITQCTAIANCDVSNDNNNTWMNGCQTCETGYSHLVAASNTYIDFTSCHQITKSNCLYENASNECKFCEVGYKVNSSNECEEDPDKITNCDTASFTPAHSPLTSTYPSSEHEKNTFDYLFFKYQDSLRKETCEVCSAGNILVGKSVVSSDQSCVPLADFTDSYDQNCLVFSGAEEAKCLRCKTDFIMDEDSSVCVASSTFNTISNCVSFKETDGVKECTSCAENSLLQTNTKTCEMVENCKSLSLSAGEVVCNLCNPGYIGDPRDLKRCITMYLPFCLEESSSRICNKCEEGKKLITVSNYLSSSAITYCSDHEYNSDEQGFSTISILGNGSGNINSITLQNEETGFVKAPGSTTIAENTKVITQICHSKGVPNCNSYADSNNVICATCEDGYYLEPNSQSCLPKSVSNCETQTSFYGCGTCNENYFRTSILTCEENTSDHCDSKSRTSNSCDDCEEGYYRSEGGCFAYTNLENCVTPNETKNKCFQCDQEFYLNTDEICVARTNITCKEYNRTEDSCTSCPDKHYENSGLCVRHTVENCDDYHSGVNLCSSCIMTTDSSTYVGNYRFDSDDRGCIPFEKLEGCSNYSLISNHDQECLICAEGYYMMDKKCHKNPHGTPYCLEYSSANICSLCEYDYFLDSATSTCEPIYRPVVNCVVHATASTCKTCMEGYLLNSDSTVCDMITENSCLTWATVDSCASCGVNQKLEASTEMSSDGTNPINTCVAVSLTDCLEIETVLVKENQELTPGIQVEIEFLQDQCKVCKAHLVISEDKKSCEKPSPVMNCLVYSNHKNCARCNRNFVLNDEKNKCTPEIELVGVGCLDASLSKDVKCHNCASGYMMGNDGACAECGGGGCTICDPENTSKCLLCAPGYYMTSSSSCSQSSASTPEIQIESIDKPSSRLLSEIEMTKGDFNR